MSAEREEARAGLLALLREARGQSDAAFDAVDDAAWRAQHHREWSPLGWHQGHVAAFEEHWILTRCKGDPPADPEFARCFSPLETPKESRSVRLPSRDEVRRFARDVRARALDYLARADLEAPHPLLADARIVRCVLAHEHQHTETAAYILALAGRVGEGLALRPRGADWTPHGTTAVHVPAGRVVLGAGADDPDAYDNERGAHEVELRDFWIDVTAASNAQYATFVELGGYREPKWWSEAGWAWVQREGARAPRYWGHDPLAYARARLDPAHPVQRLSWFEADAYARWTGGRLPTEAEWERAARWDAGASRGRRYPWGERPPDASRAVFDRRFDGPSRVDDAVAGASPVGCLGMAGGVWEWTSTPFAPYPGFAPWPYEGYSRPYFDGEHYVMRGGSWASRPAVLRASFRNWYARATREVFAGVRVVRDEV